MGQKLSNIEVVLLSIVNEKPSYAYEVDKIIEARDMRRWVRIGVASIYQVLKRLEAKELVYFRKEKEGRMPERKRYYITEYGKDVLIKAAKRLLANLEWYYLDLNVGLEAADLLTVEEMTSCLSQRLNKVQTNKKRLQAIYSAENRSTLKRKAVIENLINLRVAEEKFLKEFLREMSSRN